MAIGCMISNVISIITVVCPTLVANFKGEILFFHVLKHDHVTRGLHITRAQT